jgi:hypothetical protein
MYTPPPPMDEFNKIWTPKKKIQSADKNIPPEIKKFLPYPSEKTRTSKKPMHITPQKWLFQTPSEILVHRGVCTLNGMALVIFHQSFSKLKSGNILVTLLKIH